MKFHFPPPQVAENSIHVKSVSHYSMKHFVNIHFAHFFATYLLTSIAQPDIKQYL